MTRAQAEPLDYDALPCHGRPTPGTVYQPPRHHRGAPGEHTRRPKKSESKTIIRLQLRASPRVAWARKERTTTLSPGSNGPRNLLEDAAGASFPMPSRRFNNQWHELDTLRLASRCCAKVVLLVTGIKPPPRIRPACWPEQGSPVVAAP